MDTRTRSSNPLPPATRANTRRREVEHANLSWLDIAQPTSSDVSYLRERFKFDSLLVEDILSTIQRPKLDIRSQEEYIFVVVHMPGIDRDNRVVRSEVDIFVGRDFVVTLHDSTLKPLRRLFAAAATDESARAQLLGHGPGYLLYRIIDALVKQCFPLLYRSEEEIDQLDVRLFEQNTHLMARDLTDIQRDIIMLDYVISPNQPIIEAIQQLQDKFLRLDMPRYFGDCVDSIGRLKAMVDQQKTVVAVINETHRNVLIQHTHKLLRRFMFTTIAIIPFIVLASLAGLNVVLPFETQPLLFPGILVVVLALTLGILSYAYNHRWF
ncbi:MAG: Mg2+ and Co2+ transporter CorA [Chloroflexi bacterium AL-W]|nr:Mg2+ and Co2+ transporter CorA [Chloroflexi bacterium AL-N1]NOK68016.1 Mg2+ and Co2+ transporter CorA [Chloroflexi bacterium AL-N10]NOK73356.1 Mg2+ and Co2+ transporter CorA [Chloroflexi bacterium AL-N5]NOK83270.1 Mg2+ and Co2+ transporter CorA [Chloroflexi bacterium AL-W]NOK87687.1 Mg2+ and Co2+ transporter CorA [Chloroflexi bacterium AL-N15]